MAYNPDCKASVMFVGNTLVNDAGETLHIVGCKEATTVLEDVFYVEVDGVEQSMSYLSLYSRIYNRTPPKYVLLDISTGEEVPMRSKASAIRYLMNLYDINHFRARQIVNGNIPSMYKLMDNV